MTAQRIPGLAKNQHYVPQFLLKNFAEGKKDQVFVFDKAYSKSFRSNVKNVACENGFYNLSTAEVFASFEPALGALEDTASPIIKKICKDSALTNITEDERQLMACFMAVQMVRTAAYRATFADVMKQFDAVVKKKWGCDISMGGLEDVVDAAKAMSLHSLISGGQEYAQSIASKQFVLFKSSKDDVWIGDHPLVLNNESPSDGFRGNLGLECKGIQIFLPLSSRLILGAICPSVYSDLEKASQGSVAGRFYFFNMMRRIESGMAEEITEDNVIFMNSLQVSFSERFVYSQKGKFDLAEKMIAETDRYRSGMRMTVG